MVVRRACAAILLAGLLPATAGAAPLPPAEDPFYAAPPDLAAHAPGAILRTREVDVSLGPVALGEVADAYQLLYRTNDAHDRPVANVTTVLVPKEAAPEGGRDLLSLHDAEDSVDWNCAPSYQLQKGEEDSGNLAIETTIASPQLALGRAIVIPDHEGPESQYIVTGMEGHAALDSIRAVERFEPAGLAGAATKVGMIGYSGGAHVTAAASELAPGYAPELNIVGVAEGGVPVGNMDTIRYLDGSVGAGVLMATSIAMDRAYPELALESRLNEKGKAFAEEASKGCATSVFAAPGARFSEWTHEPDVFSDPVVAGVIERNRLGHHTPTAPTFVYNGVHDELVWIKPVDELVAGYCADGATIEYVRDQAGAEHIQAVANFVALAVPYLLDRWAGRPAPNTCGAPANTEGSTEPAPAPDAAAAPAPSRCRRRTVVIRPRTPRSFKARRITVMVNGRAVKRLRRPRGPVRLSLRGTASGRVRVVLRIAGRQRGTRRTLRVRRTYRLC